MLELILTNQNNTITIDLSNIDKLKIEEQLKLFFTEYEVLEDTNNIVVFEKLGENKLKQLMAVYMIKRNFDEHYRVRLKFNMLELMNLHINIDIRSIKGTININNSREILKLFNDYIEIDDWELTTSIPNFVYDTQLGNY